MRAPDDWVEVGIYNFRHEAEVARSVLEGSDIPAVVRSDDAGGQLFDLRIVHGARLYVQQRDKGRAREALA